MLMPLRLQDELPGAGFFALVSLQPLRPPIPKPNHASRLRPAV